MSQVNSISPSEALSRLEEGNRRFVAQEMTHFQRIHDERLRELMEGQSPYAAVLACADSRTAPSHIFDAGLGELFVCRNAGNLVDEVTLGSFEYAAAQCGCPLLCVLGHDRCGAVGAAVAAARDPGLSESPNVDGIIRRLLPAVLAARPASGEMGTLDARWIDAAARENVRMVCAQIAQRSPLLSRRVERGELMVVGGFYDLASGEVTFFTE